MGNGKSKTKGNNKKKAQTRETVQDYWYQENEVRQGDRVQITRIGGVRTFTRELSNNRNAFQPISWNEVNQGSNFPRNAIGQ